MNHPYTQRLYTRLVEHADKDQALTMKKYMRENYDFLGIKAAPRREVVREVIKEYGRPPEKEFSNIIKDLWDLPERECQYVALDLIDRKIGLNEEDIQLLEYLVLHKSWWDTVDWIATKHAGAYFQQYPQHIPGVTGRWIKSENIWLQRSTILFQLKYKQHTDEETLFHYITHFLDSDEFFINKAIGWALREYSKTNPSSVTQFVKHHKLSTLSRTEALKYLKAKNKL
ncbi:DNA alkylation repair protein [Alkalibacillus haloalkaliphilus]|uniref:DNA alkylation repair protein n=1 Tax=Alkalibacillus haloalkaliphilus TaxID=94136 RepID=UPI002936197D|nr:DNA alkylation repair protein [Alkalibacillus haloalkaliphilus]MDV2581895.1 DNA alkylation repair protein [Alkalibacillus haloalkaliphilus]